MIRPITTYLAIVFVVVVSINNAFAQDFPAQGKNAAQAQTSIQTSPQQPFYGYVPPPPIRHTWPGGYKVIFHEMMNTLMDHIIGQY